MAQTGDPERLKLYGQIVARTWSDAGFKQRLLSDPKSVCAEYGIPVPADQTIVIHESTDKVTHLVLPSRPHDLSDERLEQVAGGAPSDASGTTSTTYH